MDAPKVSMDLPTGYVKDNYPRLENGEYIYREADEYIRLQIPSGGVKTVYTIDGSEPSIDKNDQVKGHALTVAPDINGVNFGKIDLPKAVPGQETIVKAVSYDAENNPGKMLTVVCRRVKPTAPVTPLINEYNEYYHHYDAGSLTNCRNRWIIDDATAWQVYKTSEPEIRISSEKLLLALNNAYAYKLETLTSSNKIEEGLSDILQFCVTAREDIPEETNWVTASMYYGSAGNTEDLANQNRWLAINPYPANEGSVNRALFFDNVRSECYLHIRAVSSVSSKQGVIDESSEMFAASPVQTIHIVRKMPEVTSLDLDVVNGVYLPDNHTVRFSQYMQFMDAAGNMDIAQYYYGFDKNEPVTTVDINNMATGHLIKDLDTGKWYSEKKFDESGYLSVFAVNGENVLGPAYTLRLERLESEQLDNLGALSDAYNNKVVMFDCPLLVEGVENTADNAKFMYVRDPEGNVIKFVNNGANIFFNEQSHYATGQEIPAGGIAGVYRYNDGWPQIDVYVDAGADYRTYSAPGQTPATTWAAAETARKDITNADFNRHVVVSGLTWTDSESAFTTEDGGTLVGYGRFVDRGEPLGGLTKGKSYIVEGFVGQIEGQLRIFPIKITPEITLMAPNPIAADPDADGWTTVNVISDAVKLTVDKSGFSDDTRFGYRLNNATEYTEWTDANLTIDDFTGGSCELQVAILTDGVASDPLKIRFVKHELEGTFDNIADFKALYPDEVVTPDPKSDEVKYYRYTGKAQVRAITPRYLYLRDYENCPAGEESQHSLLLYNENGWNAAVEMQGGDGSRARTLKEGDIITDFVLIADRIPQMHGLRGYATGFARTLHRVEVDPEPVSDPKILDAADEDFEGFTDADRMVRYWIENVTVTHREDGVYVLDIPGAPELNINDVFQYTGGWATSYRAGTVYKIEGVVLLNGKPVDGQTKHYAVALTDFEIAGDVPELAIPTLEGVNDGDASAPLTFMTTAKVVLAPVPGSITKDGDEELKIYYTLDGSDPRNNPNGRIVYTEPFEISSSVTVKAYAAIAGHMPSAVVERTFSRSANDRRYIVNFINQAEPAVAYHFTGDARVAKIGGDYMFVRGAVGHYLPIRVTDNAIDLSEISEGAYLADFVAEADFVNDRVRGALITPEYAGHFGGVLDPAPENLDITFEPDEVTTITAENARRYVRISGVKLIGTEFEAEDGISQQDTEWKLITNRGEESGVEIRVNHNILKPEFDWDNTDNDVAAYYNITGFAMLGDDGVIELWPTEVEKVRAAKLVVPEFEGGIISKTQMLELTTVEFYPSTTVTLTCPVVDPSSATIEYIITPDENAPADDAKWNVYAQPFAVTSDSYIHMRASAPGYETSAHSHIDMRRAAAAGSVEFDAVATPGTTTVTIKADAGGAKIYWTDDNTLPQSQWSEYSDELSFNADTRIWAYAKVGNNAGAVSQMVVIVIPEQTETPVDPVDPVEPTDPADPEDPSDPTQPEKPADRVSGRVVFSLDDSEPGKVKVKIEPETMPAGNWNIYYTTDPNVVLTKDTGKLYQGAFEVTEKGIVMAILVEEGKPETVVCEVYVWVTAIDSVGADSVDSVRADGDSIIAPEGSEVYDLSGRRVRPEGLRSGIYIVRTPDGKAVKVAIR